MSAVWNTFVNGVQGVHVKAVDVAGCTVQRYDMGRAVGTFAADAEDAEDAETANDAQAVTFTVKAATTGSKLQKNSKAEIVREMIRRAKAEGRTAETVVAEVVDTLGFTRQLAKGYLKANWQRA